jgi:lysophospholipase L1-like esterase
MGGVQSLGGYWNQLNKWVDYDFKQGVDPNVLYDVSGNNRHAAIARVNNKPFFNSTGIDFAKGTGTITGPAMSLGDRTTYIAIKWNPLSTIDKRSPLLATADGKIILSAQGSGYAGHGISSYPALGSEMACANKDNTDTVINDNKWHILTFVDGTTTAGTSFIYFDGFGLRWRPSAIQNIINASSFTVGAWTNIHYGSEMGRLTIFPELHNSSTVLKNVEIIRKLLTVRGAIIEKLSSDIPYIVCVGDSFMDNANAMLDVFHQSVKTINPNWIYGDFAENGKSLAVNEGYQPTIVNPLVRMSQKNNVLFIWGFGNDMGLDPAAENTYNRLKRMTASARAAGYNKVISGTMIPKLNENYNIGRNHFNEFLRNDHSFLDGIADFASDPIYALDSAPTDHPELYVSDGFHPSNAGGTRMEPYLTAVLRSVLGL